MVGRRILAFVVDFLILFVIGFFCFPFVSRPIVEHTTNIKALESSYYAHEKQYQDLEDQYHIYYYTEEGERKKNNDVTEVEKTQFENDENVIALRKQMYKEMEGSAKIVVLQIFISEGVAAIPVFIILPLCLRKGRTVGKLIFKLALAQRENKYQRWYLVLARQTLNVIINVLLGSASFGLIPVGNLLCSIFSKENRSIDDWATCSRVVENSVPIEMNSLDLY